MSDLDNLFYIFQNFGKKIGEKDLKYVESLGYSDRARILEVSCSKSRSSLSLYIRYLNKN